MSIKDNEIVLEHGEYTVKQTKQDRDWQRWNALVAVRPSKEGE